MICPMSLPARRDRLARLSARLLRPALGIAAALSQACAHLPATSHPFSAMLPMNGHPLTLHLANPGAPPDRPLLLYTTGDGGWARKDLALYRQIVSWGYPTAGFSAPQYLKHLRSDETTTPERLGQDYARLIREAEARLRRPAGAPVILIGVSRGAGLEVVAAAHPAIRPVLRGVIAIALTREEEYVRWRGLRLPGIRRPAKPVMLEIYEYLALLHGMPVAVVQSTRDRFLPADEAARLFGADSATRRFRAIDARDHSFGGSRRQMYDAAREALAWIVGDAPDAASR